MYLLLSILAALAYTVGGIYMKKSDGLKHFAPTMLVFLLFLMGAAVQTVAMRKAELTVTYLFIVGLESVLAVTFGTLLFQEGCSWLKLSGVTLIVAGILLLHMPKS
jgi:small multidrug resistance pump/quaternary ammonium compound-resistance protein SugE